MRHFFLSILSGEANMKRKLSNARLIAFVSPEVAMASFMLPLIIFVPPYYSGEIGLGLATVGLIFGLTKLWDVVTDPIVGVLSDRLRTSFGRRRPLFAIAIPLLMFCTYKVYLPPVNVTATYFACWMILLYIAWTLITLSHISWALELSPDYHERSRIAGYKQAAGLIGMALVSVVAVAIDLTGEPSQSARMAAIGLFVIFLLPVTGVAALLSTSEPPISDFQSSKHQNVRFSDLLAAVRGNRPLRLLLSANVLISIGASAISGSLLFFVESVLDLRQFSSVAMIPMILSGLLFLPGWIALAYRVGKHSAFKFSMVYLVCVFPLLMFLPEGIAWICFIAFVFAGAYNGVIAFLPQTMMADITDMDALYSGERRTGLYVALLQTSSKLSSALGVAVTYLALSFIGFDPDPEMVNSPEVLQRMRYLFALLPVVFFSAAWLTMRQYPLDERSQAELRNGIDMMLTKRGSAG